MRQVSDPSRQLLVDSEFNAAVTLTRGLTSRISLRLTKRRTKSGSSVLAHAQYNEYQTQETKLTRHNVQILASGAISTCLIPLQRAIANLTPSFPLAYDANAGI